MTPKEAVAVTSVTTQLLRETVTSRSQRGCYEVTTRSLRSLRGHYGYYAVTTVTAVRKHMFEAEKTLNFAPKGLKEIVAEDLEFH